MENKKNSDIVLSLSNFNNMYMLLAEFIMIVAAPQLIYIIYKNAPLHCLIYQQRLQLAPDVLNAY